MANEKNVLGKPLQLCCGNTGFTREGFCYVPEADLGNHSVCAVMDEPFLAYSQAQGNDLTTPRPDFDFPGLKPGDRWCVCAARWLEAYHAGAAPRINLNATHQKALDLIPMAYLELYAL